MINFVRHVVTEIPRTEEAAAALEKVRNTTPKGIILKQVEFIMIYLDISNHFEFSACPQIRKVSTFFRAITRSLES